MNTLKSMLVVGALAVVGYGVYVVLNNNPSPAPIPDEVKAATLPQFTPPTVQLSGGDSGLGQPVSPSQLGSPANATTSPGALVQNPSYTGPLAGVGGPPPEVMMPAKQIGSSADVMPGAPANTGGNSQSNGTPAGSPAAGTNSGAFLYPASSGYGSQQLGPSGSALPARPAVSASGRYGDYRPTQNPGNPGDAISGTEGGRAPLYPNNNSADPNLSPRRDAAGTATDLLRGSAANGNGPNDGRFNGSGLGGPSGAQALAFDVGLSTARNLLDRGQLDAALVSLSAMYDDPRLTDRQREQLNDLLDQVSGTVIYSRRKYSAENTYRVVGSERLEDIAKRCNVPTELLAKINGIQPRSELKVGQELKILRGPFQAIINVSKRTLTLMIDNRYAGRFPVVLGPEFSQLEGRFAVAEKDPGSVRYQGQRCLTLAPEDGSTAAPPLAIVGVENRSGSETSQARGLIVVSPNNADDLYDILSRGSSVTIRR